MRSLQQQERQPHPGGTDRRFAERWGDFYMKHCCRNCHFLKKDTSAYGTQSWDKEDRDYMSAKRSQRQRIPRPGFLRKTVAAFKISKVGCHKGEWERPYDELANGFSRQSLKDEILKKRERTGKCNFGEYHAGMTFPDAEDIFRVSRDIRHQESTLLWQKFAAIFAFLAFFATLISIYLQILEQSSAP